MGSPENDDTAGKSSSDATMKQEQDLSMETSSSSSPQEEDLLEQRFFYQNPQTGSVSAATLTARQLCRILSPPISSDGSTTTRSIISPDTLVIAFDPVTSAYSKEGWKAAKQWPLLGEACSKWYFVDSNTGDSSNNTKKQKSEVKGPFSCRVLSNKLFEGKSHEELAKCLSETKVWTSDLPQDGETAAQWRAVTELPKLHAALGVFHVEQPSSTFTKKTEKEKQGSSPKSESQPYDPATMTFDSGSQRNENDMEMDSKAKAELEAFLSSTGPAHTGLRHLSSIEDNNGATEDDEEDETYESDGGTPYVKDPFTGNWIHADLAPPRRQTKTTEKKSAPKRPAGNNKSETLDYSAVKKRKKGGKFTAKKAKHWIYVTGLPPDTDEDEVNRYFSKVGILELNPDTQKPKIKLYRQQQQQPDKGETDLPPPLKGDASLCYARPESVDMAIQLLDESLFRPNDRKPTIQVQRAKFEQHGDKFEENRRARTSDAKRKVARLAALQAVGWDEDGENGRITGGRKGLRIIVLKHMFDPSELQAKSSKDAAEDEEDKLLHKLEQDIRKECQEFGGTVEKITVFSKNPLGVVIVKFAQPSAASLAVNEYNGRVQANGRKIEAHFWDGVTDYTVRDEEKEEKEAKERHEKFGEWLDNQELPEEFKLQVEGS